MNRFAIFSGQTRVSVVLLLLIISVSLIQCKVNSAGSANNTKTIRALIVGGGSSHDFNRWYKQADSITLAKDGFASVKYTSDMASVSALLPETDVLYLTNNQPVSDPSLRQAIFDFVDKGKGLVLAHAATWYNWRDWPDYNSKLVGGGSRGHERYGDFQVNITDSQHPITKNISEKQFSLKDELYRMTPDSAGSGIQVLGIATVPNSTSTYPILWVTKTSKGRVVGFTLGHDGEAHDRPVYQELLRNAVRWAAAK